MSDRYEELAREFWPEHAQEFADLQCGNLSSREEDEEIARVKKRNEEGIAALSALLRRVAEEAQQQEFHCGGCGETMVRCAGPFTERAEQAESELSAAREQVRRLREALAALLDDCLKDRYSFEWTTEQVDADPNIALARAALAETAQEEEK